MTVTGNPTHLSALGRILRIDGVGAAVSGLVLVALAGALQDWLGLPGTLARVAGGLLLVWGAWQVGLSTRALPGWVLPVVLSLDLLWIAATVATAVVVDALTGLGVVLVLAQGVLVGGLAVAESLADRADRGAAPVHRTGGPARRALP